MDNVTALRDVFNYFTDDLSLTFDTDTASELIGLLETDDDACIMIDGEEYRIIHDNIIEGTWDESLIELLKDCYEVPEALENYIDYDKWANDCKMDGMGHHFASYDGEEHGVADWYMFRVN